MVTTRHGRLSALVGIAVIVASCGDPTGPELVTISGIVRNVDTGQPAPGVRVQLYGTSYADEVATGADGAYLLKVPRGSTLWLFTDDFDNSTADTWFPFINVDHPNLVADRDLLDWSIHSCPHSGGSVDAWNRHLRDVDPVAGDRFSPTTAAEAGGILFIGIWDVRNGDWSIPTAGFQLGVDSPSFPVGYTIGDSLIAGRGLYFHPPDRTTTDSVGIYTTFADTTFAGDRVTITIADTDTLRAYAFASPWVIPVARGTITFGNIGAVDGVLNRSTPDIYCAAGFFSCPP